MLKYFSLFYYTKTIEKIEHIGKHFCFNFRFLLNKSKKYFYDINYLFLYAIECSIKALNNGCGRFGRDKNSG